jgi:single-strand DNA-binding protein
MLNTITIMGRLTATPELKTTTGGTAVTRFTLAVERDIKDKETGKRAVDFIDCIAWRGAAEFVTRYFAKGRMAVVNGRLQLHDYTDTNGIKRCNAEIVVENVYFGDSANTGTGNANAGQQAAPAPAPAYTQPAPTYEELNDDEELPF